MCQSHTASKRHSHGLRSCPRWKQLNDLPEFMSFSGSSVVKNPPANARDTGDMSSIPGLGRPPGGGNGNLLKYSCLENSTDRGAWQDTVHGISKKERGMTEDYMIGWHHWLNGHEFGWTPGIGDGQRGLACCTPWGHKESDTTEWLNWAEMNYTSINKNKFIILISFLDVFIR